MQACSPGRAPQHPHRLPRCDVFNSAEGGVCCTRQTDVLEAASLISDATELAKVS